MKESTYWITAEEFVKTYLLYRTNKEVAAALGITPGQVADRATKLRKAGVELPVRRGRPASIDATKLNRIIRESLGGM